MIDDCERIERYVERRFQKSGRTEFPTVRQVARALNLRVSEISEIADAGDNLMLTYYNIKGWSSVPKGDWFIETINPPVENRP